MTQITPKYELLNRLKSTSKKVQVDNTQWANILSNLALEGKSIKDDKWKARYEFGRKVESIFGGMGSFNDIYVSNSAEEEKELLYEAVGRYLRECWIKIGKIENTIPDEELFCIGDRVNLIEGEVIYLNRNGSESKAPKSDFTYVVVSIDTPDISGMPTYTIRFKNKYRSARHNALKMIS